MCSPINHILKPCIIKQKMAIWKKNLLYKPTNGKPIKYGLFGLTKLFGLRRPTPGGGGTVPPGVVGGFGFELGVTLFVVTTEAVL
ncbi:hypothetical protein BpHYR1_050888 [Brachionus plicatilis]|uniref:Uncharacterized protein n=1 Tax=Brachionus plicatilis TaxID=10195 RepID=A0A3M7QUW8_BRAPC|nr:hypothetical protein BpHYR1_050888 [Brachionus plicatilis]